jgi:hypothetical protein
LLDRDGGRQPLDQIDIRLLHHLEELPRIGRQALDIAPLALGIDGVEGERGFARARQAGQHDQLVARHVDVDVLEVVLARAANPNQLHGGGDSLGIRRNTMVHKLHAWQRSTCVLGLLSTVEAAL